MKEGEGMTKNWGQWFPLGFLVISFLLFIASYRFGFMLFK